MLILPAALLPLARARVRRRSRYLLTLACTAVGPVLIVGLGNRDIPREASVWLAAGVVATVGLSIPTGPSYPRTAARTPRRAGLPRGAPTDRLRSQLAAQEEERRRIGRELHDEIGQLLTALRYCLEGVEVRSQEYGDDFAEDLQTAKGILDQGFDELHRMVLNLRPQLLDDLGLVAAVRWYAREFVEKTGLVVRADLDLTRRLDEEQESALFRIAQEAFTNVVRHANATEVTVRLEGPRDGAVTMTIEDNGCGFAAEEGGPADPSRMGLRGIVERAELLNGTCVIESRPGGSRIAVSIPV